MSDVRIRLVYADGSDRVVLTRAPSDGEWPAFMAAEGREWVLSKVAGVAENILVIEADGSLGAAPTLTEYVESEGMDATCLDCASRVRFTTAMGADNSLEACRQAHHVTMVLPVHLADSNVIDGIGRTVGDVRESTTLLADHRP